MDSRLTSFAVENRGDADLKINEYAQCNANFFHS